MLSPFSIPGEKRGGPGWGTWQACREPFVWEIAELVSANTASPAVISESPGEGKRSRFSELHGPSKGYKAKELGSKERASQRGRAEKRCLTPFH